ncbi:hypothetical protein DVH24_037554 [Malus domestica]|uniref:Uncharacterized protein n=1 Tax=Malus domestica TaxID=3750 RepID=A0A498IWW4_MALDO|nr:hypothetical protein DVH24_037554 [Malus domestica]
MVSGNWFTFSHWRAISLTSRTGKQTHMGVGELVYPIALESIPISVSGNWFTFSQWRAWLVRAIGQYWHGWEPWCKIGTIMSHGDKSMVVRSRDAGRHGCESKVGAGLGQIMHSRKNLTISIESSGVLRTRPAPETRNNNPATNQTNTGQNVGRIKEILPAVGRKQSSSLRLSCSQQVRAIGIAAGAYAKLEEDIDCIIHDNIRINIVENPSSPYFSTDHITSSSSHASHLSPVSLPSGATLQLR